MDDIIDRVNVTRLAFDAWDAHCLAIIQEMAAAGVEARAEIPDEQVVLLPSGELLFFVDAPGIGRVEMRVPVDQWEFRHPKISSN